MQQTNEEVDLLVLKKELINIERGYTILNIRKQQIETAIKEKEEELAMAMAVQNPSDLLEVQRLDTLEQEEWENEQKHIKEKQIQEIVAFEDIENDL